MSDPEALLPPDWLPSHIHLIYPGQPRPGATPVDDGTYRLGRPFEHRLDPAVAQIANPAGKPPFPRLPGGLLAVEHSLNPPGHPQMGSCLLRINHPLQC